VGAQELVRLRLEELRDEEVGVDLRPAVGLGVVYEVHRVRREEDDKLNHFRKLLKGWQEAALQPAHANVAEGGLELHPCGIGLEATEL
jgi:hypothetical protein